jgi:hypothetical protein
MLSNCFFPKLENCIESNDMKMMEYEDATMYMILFVNIQHAYKFLCKSAERNTIFKNIVKSWNSKIINFKTNTSVGTTSYHNIL